MINSDGINFVSCRKALTEDVFVRKGDDCICIKAHYEDNHDEKSSGIVVKNTILWADVARLLEFRHETNTSDAGTKLLTYKINYRTGQSVLFPVLSLTDVADWELWSRASWQFTLEGKKVYIMAIDNKSGDLIKSIEIVSGDGDEIPAILAITTGK